MNFFTKVRLQKEMRRRPKKRLGKPPRISYPKGIELTYKVALRSLVGDWKKSALEILDHQIVPAIIDAENERRNDGGEGSGNFGHEGRPGEVGGSGPGAPKVGKVTESGTRLGYSTDADKFIKDSKLKDTYYHGRSQSSIDKIPSTGLRASSDEANSSEGISFTQDKEYAKGYAGDSGHVLHVKIFSEKPISVEELDKLYPSKDIGEQHDWAKSKGYDSIVSSKEVRIFNPKNILIIGHGMRNYKMNLDAWPDTVNTVMSKIKVSFDNETTDFSIYAANIGQRTSAWNNKQWRKTMKKVLGVDDIFRPENYLGSRLKAFVHTNTDLITKLSTETVTGIRRTVEEGIRKQERYETIRDNIIEEGFATTESRAELIARDQVGKLNGELTELRQTSLGINKYIWRTAQDERVRESHEVLSGMLCSWDDDTIYSDDGGATWKDRDSIGAFIGAPGEDYQCRCYGEAVFDDIIQELEE
jgi:SPP1 gp7 family putative phage head morphogenesis protein